MRAPRALPALVVVLALLVGTLAAITVAVMTRLAKTVEEQRGALDTNADTIEAQAVAIADLRQSVATLVAEVQSTGGTVPELPVAVVTPPGPEGEPAVVGGERGEQGPVGPGPSGEQVAAAVGEYCADGRCIGATGAQGIAGETGPQGVQGLQGVQGDPGPAGASCPEGHAFAPRDYGSGDPDPIMVCVPT